MKQKYYTLNYQWEPGSCWVSTQTANRKLLENKIAQLDADGLKHSDISERVFNNYFICKPWGPGSEFRTFDYDSFCKLESSYTVRQEMNGNFYCVKGMEDHPEVKEAVQAAVRRESEAIDRYYSRPWV
jgi:hypothetical protein